MSARTTSQYQHHHFPSEIIAPAVRLSHRFSLSFRVDLSRAARYRELRDQAFTIWHEVTTALPAAEEGLSPSSHCVSTAPRFNTLTEPVEARLHREAGGLVGRAQAV